MVETLLVAEVDSAQMANTAMAVMISLLIIDFPMVKSKVKRRIGSDHPIGGARSAAGKAGGLGGASPIYAGGSAGNASTISGCTETR